MNKKLLWVLSFLFVALMPTMAVDYCTPSVSTQGGSKSYVGQIVTFTTEGAFTNANWTNPSSANLNGYDSLSDMFVVNPGQTITININDKNTTWGWVKVYVDLNGDGAFSSDEEVWKDSARNRTTPISKEVTFASDIAVGNGYLMRVFYAGGNDTNKDACGSYSEGGYYDFGFNVVANATDRTITVVSADETQGTVYIGTEGTTQVETTGNIEITAVPAEGYGFARWEIDGTEVSTENPYIDNTDGDKTYTAYFEALPAYNVNVIINNNRMGSVSAIANGAEIGTQVYEGTEVEFTATPKEGYEFINWTLNGVQVSNALTYTMVVNENTAIGANFKREGDYPQLSITGATAKKADGSSYDGYSGNGTAKIYDGSTSTKFWGYGNQENGTNVTAILSEAAPVGKIALYFSDGDQPKSAKIQISTDDVTYTDIAIFKMADIVSNQYSCNALGATAKYIRLYITEESGWLQYNEIMAYSGDYARVVTVSSSDESMGIAYIGAEGITEMRSDAEVVITAQPTEGYEFVKWTLDGEEVSTDAVYTVTEGVEDFDYVAHFKYKPITPRQVSVAANNANKGTVSIVSPEASGSSITTGEMVVVEAAPKGSDNFFVNWTINGVEVSTETTYTYLGADAVTIQANFVSRYVVTIEELTGGGITIKQGSNVVVSGSRVEEGSVLEITAKGTASNWVKSFSVNGVNKMYASQLKQFTTNATVTGPTTLSATFGTPIMYLTYEYSGNGYIEVWTSDSYNEGDEDTYPVLPAGEQYKYGDVIEEGGVCLFVFPGAGAELVSLIVDDYDETENEELVDYGDLFYEPTEPMHIVAVFSGESTGVESAEVEGADIYATAEGIVVEAADAINVEVYTIAGALVAEKNISGTTTIAVAKGVYIVKAGDKVSKVIVK